MMTIADTSVKLIKMSKWSSECATIFVSLFCSLSLRIWKRCEFTFNFKLIYCGFVPSCHFPTCSICPPMMLNSFSLSSYRTGKWKWNFFRQDWDVWFGGSWFNPFVQILCFNFSHFSVVSSVPTISTPASSQRLLHWQKWHITHIPSSVWDED